MGFTEKTRNHFHHQIQMDGFHQVDSSEAKTWVIAGIALRSQLKPILTKNPTKNDDGDEELMEESCSCTTPTSEESRIPRRLACPPPPPKKRKPSSRSSICHFNGVVRRDFFCPPDLETVFRRRAEKA